MTETATLTAERADLLETLAAHRYFLRHTVQGLTDEQARQRTTASELTLGGLIKHVADTEEKWAQLHRRGPGRDGRAQRRGRLRGVGQRPSAAPRRDARRRPGALRRGGRPHRRPGAHAARPRRRPTRCPRRRGSSRARAARPAGCSCTSSPRPPSTPGTPTSSASRWTARRRWADPARLSARRTRRSRGPGSSSLSARSSGGPSLLSTGGKRAEAGHGVGVDRLRGAG